ncbi:pilus assembly protein TadG-related protein [Guyparkeria sp.]|uniref:pilus assembly protein TadG-related protein n=1 Tax=Guyparkeria sp. TaxID=2035736 RepID=UPI00397100E1
MKNSHLSGPGTARRAGSDHGQRGSVIFSVLVLILGLAVAALAVDTGRLFFEKRQLQNAVDMAALSAVNASGFCGSATGTMQERLEAAAQDALEKNGFDTGASENDWDMLIGTASVEDGLRKFDRTDDVTDPRSDSVMVLASREVPTSLLFGGWLTDNRQTIEAVAAARDQTPVSFAVGSELVRLDSNQSALLEPLLGGLLGSEVDLGVGGFEGLVNSHVSLFGLQEAAVAELGLNVGTVEGLLDTDLSVAEFIRVLARAVDRADFLEAAAYLGDLETVALQADELSLRLGDILAIDAPGPDALKADINAGSLLMTGLVAGNLEHGVEVDLGVDLAGLTPGGIGLQLDLIEPPQIAVGPAGKKPESDWGNTGSLTDEWRTVASTAQGNLSLQVPLELLGLLSVDLHVDLELGRGEAALTSVECPTWNDPNAYTEFLVQPAVVGNSEVVADVQLGDGLLGELLGLLLSKEVLYTEIPLLVQTPDGGFVGYEVPPEGDARQVSGSASQGSSIGGSVVTALDTLTEDIELNLLGLPLGDLLQPVLEVLAELLSPVLSVLDEVLVDPLLELLGLQVARAEIQAGSIEIGQGQAELVF